MFKDLTGQRFGRLVVVEFNDLRVFGSGRRSARWKCVCDCGGVRSAVFGTNLTTGQTASCGCYADEVHTKTIQKVNRRKRTCLAKKK